MASSIVHSSSRIELLSKENYDTWSMQVEALLTRNELWGYVDGTIGLPLDDDERAAWLKVDGKAKADLILSIQPSELKQVRGCETSREVWVKLESIYASKGPARKATLLKQLMLQRLEEGGDVKDHISKFVDAVDKLESMAVQINGDLMSIMLLYSLPSSFENFRCAIESRDDLPKAEILKIKIIEESEARKQASGNSVIAMAAGYQKSKVVKLQKGKVYSKREIRCFKCGVIGHKANKCMTSNSAAKDKSQSNQSSEDSFAVCYSASVNKRTQSVQSKRTAYRSWILDSGCTAHLCGDKNRFEHFSETVKSKINLANQACADVNGKGVVHLTVTADRGQGNIRLENTLFVPNLRTNLTSVSKIVNKGYKVIFEKNIALVYRSIGDLSFIADRKGDLFYVREDIECAAVQAKCSELSKWHCRLGHLNAKDLLKLVHDGILPAINISDVDILASCEVCLKGKMTALPFPKGRVPFEEVLGIVHSDVVGPFRLQSNEGARYFVTFVDDSTRWCEVYFLREKSGVLEAFKAYQSHVEKQTGKSIKCLQSDNGREYCNNIFDKYLTDHGIVRRLTIPHTPQQNGVAERLNRTLLDMARCLLLQSGLTGSFWSTAVATASYIRNRCPTSSLSSKTPYEVFWNKRPKMNYFKTFGSKVMVLDKDPKKSKLAPRAVEGVFVGYPRDRKGYRIWLSSERKILYARDVKFVNEIHCRPQILCDVDELVDMSNKLIDKSAQHPKFVELPNSIPVSIPEEANEPEPDLKRAPGRPRIERTGARGRPRKLFHYHASEASEEVIPVANHEDDDDDVFAGIAEVSVKKALEGPAADEWMDAIESEVVSLIKNETFDIVKTSESDEIIGCRFVLTNKCGSEGNVVRRKARLVAKGYGQKYGINYHDTFAPVARLETVRLVLALSVHFGFTVWQFDVVTAYLHGILEEKVLMKMPDMLNVMLERIVLNRGAKSDIGIRAEKLLQAWHDGGNACKLRKALYGLKQAGRQWYIKLSTKLKSMGLKPILNEPCLFFGVFDKDLTFLLIYVDDILVAANNEDHVKYIKNQLSQTFEIKDLGLAEYCLGLEVKQFNNIITLKQKGYINELLKRYGMHGCNPVSTPAEVNMCLDNPIGKPYDERQYRELVGALMYLSVATRPDIANAVSKVAQFVNKPFESHWHAAKRILRYLAGSAHKGLTYKRTNKSLIAFTDADWGGCGIDRRSYTGYVYILSGAAISWKSQKQRTVALSSTEAEYVSLAEAAKEALYLRSLLNELGLKDFADIIIYMDNKGAQCLANNPIFHTRTKHIDIKHHFVRESITNGLFVLEHVSTQQMVADVLTKSLPRVNHERCTDGLGIAT